jgi:dTDP-4-amino-4,6-dideoxygalactose transaminase
MIRHSSSYVVANDFGYISQLAEKNFVGQGELCDGFSSKLRDRFGRQKCLLTRSGAASIEIGLHVLRMREPDANEIVLSGYVCPTVVSAVVREGLKPIFVDVQKRSMNIDSVAVERVITKKTLAVVMTHIGGCSDPIDDLLSLNIPLVSDCAQALGATWRGKELTAYGDFSSTSFGPTKVMTTGVGGALFADKDFFYCAQRHSRQELSVSDYESSGFIATHGQSFSDLAAGLGLAQLDRFHLMLERRRYIADRYTALLKSRSGIKMPILFDECVPNNYRYYFFSSSASKWIRHLQKHNIDARSSFSHCMADYFPNISSMPNLKRNVTELISLPIHMALTNDDLACIEDAFEHGFFLGLQ